MWQYCVYLLTSKLLHFTSEHFILGYSLRLEFVNSCLISTRLPYVHSGFVVSTSESVGLARTSQDIQLSHFISLDFEDQRIWTSRPQIRHNVRVGERTVLKYVSHLALAMAVCYCFQSRVFLLVRKITGIYRHETVKIDQNCCVSVPLNF